MFVRKCGAAKSYVAANAIAMKLSVERRVRWTTIHWLKGALAGRFLFPVEELDVKILAITENDLPC